MLKRLLNWWYSDFDLARVMFWMVALVAIFAVAWSIPYLLEGMKGMFEIFLREKIPSIPRIPLPS